MRRDQESCCKHLDEAKVASHDIKRSTALDYCRKAESLIRHIADDADKIGAILLDNEETYFLDADEFEHRRMSWVKAAFSEYWSGLTRSTQRFYSAALRYYLDVFVDCVPAWCRSILNEVVGVTPARVRGGAKPRSTDGYAKGITSGELSLLVDHLTRQGPHGHFAAAMMLAGVAFGLRPAEWLGAELIEEPEPEPEPETETAPEPQSGAEERGDDAAGTCDEGDINLSSASSRYRLVVQNAKDSHGRSFGPTRTLHFSSKDVDWREVAAARFVIDMIPGYLKVRAQTSTIIDLDHELGLDHVQRLVRLSREQAGIKRKIVLYTARHQFAADAKYAGLHPEKIAALMGHRSVRTAKERYGKRRTGKARGPEGEFPITPDPANVAAVKQLSQINPTGQPPAESEDDESIPDFLRPAKTPTN